MNKHEQLNIL